MSTQRVIHRPVFLLNSRSLFSTAGDFLALVVFKSLLSYHIVSVVFFSFYALSTN